MCECIANNDEMKKIIRISVFLWCALCTVSGRSQDFDAYFEDNTLRVDYIFAGTAEKQQLFVDELSASKGWYGRRDRLAELLLMGNGQLTMCDVQTGDTIYRHSFSTLFQEWLATDEARKLPKSFENCFQVPMPKRSATITVTLCDNRQQPMVQMTHEVNPKDVLIHWQKSNVPYRYIHQGGDPKKCIDIAILAEGYTEQEMEQFYIDCQTAADALFEHQPFGEMRSRLNIVAVAAPSAESGVSVPAEGVWKQTTVGSNFDTFYSSRYLTTSRLKQMNNLLAGIPYEHIIVLANTATYGGGGIFNSYTLTAVHHPLFRSVVVHEFGHSFGGLADEYYNDTQLESLYSSDTEPWEPNITTLVNFESKWKDMLPDGVDIPTPLTAQGDEIYTSVGVYEGAGYQAKGAYRPVPECRMKINEAPAFCPVCQRALRRLIEFYTE